MPFAAGLIEEEYVCPPQQQIPDTPERALWRGVLVLALRDLSKKQFRRSSVEWFSSDSTVPNSFLWLCDELGINPDYLRRLINEKSLTMNNTKITQKTFREMGGDVEKHDRGMPETVWSSLRGRRA